MPNLSTAFAKVSGEQTKVDSTATEAFAQNWYSS